MQDQRNSIPINILPDELLLRIFSILVDWDTIYCGYRDGEQLSDHDKRIYQDTNGHATIISRVNTSWRQLVINTPSFWSHIDLFLEYGYWLPPSAHTRRCFERVKDAPIELHLNCGRMQRFYTPIGITPHYLRNRTVTSLILIASYPAVVQPIIGAYLRNPLTKLQVESITTPSRQSVICTPPSEPISQHQLLENLLRLNVLRLSGAVMDWTVARFSGLVELQLRNLQPSPSMDQIYDILAASPELYTIELEQLHIECYILTGFRSKARIKLPKLGFLHLGGRTYEFVDSLIQAIEPIISQLCLKITILEASFDNPGSFLIQHNVGTLSLRVPRLPVTLLGQILSPQKDLTTLVLTDQYADDFYVVPDTGGPHSTGLRCVVLRRCRVTFLGLRRIALIHSIRSLWLERCMYTPQANSDFSLELPEDELNWLEGTIPNLYVDYVHHGQTPNNLPWWMW